MPYVYRLIGPTPRTLVYRDARVILECVDEPSMIAFTWEFRARKLAPAAGVCVILRGVSRNRLHYSLRVEGFACDANSAEERIMEALVALGKAEKYHKRS